MPRLPVMSGEEFAKVLRHLGYTVDHISGSHMILLNESGHRLSVPRHKELDRGLLQALIRDAGLTREEFFSLIQGK